MPHTRPVGYHVAPACREIPCLARHRQITFMALSVTEAMTVLDLWTRQVYDLTAGQQVIAITSYDERFPYRLKVMAGSNSYVTAAIQEVLAILPQSFALAQNYPNPFNPSTTLGFELPVATVVTIIVYDLLGREVVRLMEGHLEPGYHQVQWDGKMASGRDVPTGLYIARMTTPAYTRAIKLVLLK